MSDVSKIIRERALAILRDTRAKIDPALLTALKDRISETMPDQRPQNAPIAQKYVEKPSVAPLEQKFIPPVMKEALPASSGAEPVDKQKIAQIVLEYMKNRELGQKH